MQQFYCLHISPPQPIGSKTMDLFFKVKYASRKTLLHIMGPATLTDHRNPIKVLEQEWEHRFGPRPAKPAPQIYVPKRHMSQAA